MVSLETKKQIAIQISTILSEHLNKFTPVVAIHDGKQIIDHGTGIFLLIEDTPIVVTAAHVVKDYPNDQIHIIGTFTPSNYRSIVPVEKEFWGGEIGEKLDIGYLVLPKDCIEIYGVDSFLTPDRIEVFPERLSTDLVFFYGMPEVLHDRASELEDRFQPFMYGAGIEDDTDWTKPGNRPVEIAMDYPIIVRDTITKQDIETYKPSGMSGGGVWRSYINRARSIYTADLSKLIAIGTEWIESTGNIKANRIETAMHLLSERFPSVEKVLNCPTSQCRRQPGPHAIKQ
jgi:hypothetical protein